MSKKRKKRRELEEMCQAVVVVRRRRKAEKNGKRAYKTQIEVASFRSLKKNTSLQDDFLLPKSEK
jgi:hypothetical protein